MKSNYLLLAIALLSWGTVFSQSKKDIKKNKVKTVSVSKTFTKDGKEITLKESFNKYDADGNMVEEINYDENGTVKGHQSFVYTKNGDKTEEAHYEIIGLSKLKKEIARLRKAGKKIAFTNGCFDILHKLYTSNRSLLRLF